MSTGHRDEQMEAEHQAVLDLIKTSEVTFKAVKSGSWFSPSTWANGKVPTADAVVQIPKGMTVTYDGNSSTELFKVRVDGKLAFATDRSTKMVLDTMVVEETGTLQIGSATKPLPSSYKADIVFADNGSVNDLDWDVRQLSRGLISHGTVDIHGQAKTSFLKVAADPMAGQSSITLSKAPSGWKAGDKVVLTGTDYMPEKSGVYQGTRDEVLTIKSISGSKVTFNETLKYDHDTPASELKAYAANMTRNVTFSSENKDDVDHRGHVMFMHNDNVDVHDAAFVGLGRSDKSEPLDDRRIVEDEDGVSAPFVPGTEYDNPRGRYAVHLHRTGADNDAATVEGSVVWGSPGWGYVSHDSHADFIDNVSYDVFGAHYASETGNERGKWTHNIAIKGEGRDPTRFEKYDVATHDLGYEGNGFWFNGRQVVAQDNVAAGMSGFAYEWFNRGDNMIDTHTDTLTHPEIANYEHHIASDKPAIEGFVNNEALASWGGIFLHRWFYTQNHDQRSYLADFKGWEVAEGIKATYTTNYLLEDMEFWDADRYTSTIGADVGKNTKSITLRDIDFHDFKNGVILRKDFDPVPAGSDPLKEDHQYIFVGVGFDNVATPYSSRYNPTYDHVLPASAVKPTTLRMDFKDSSLKVQWGESYAERKLAIAGTKIDSIGSVSWPAAREKISLDNTDLTNLLRTRGFWSLPDGSKVIKLETLFSDRATGEIATKPFLAVFDSRWNLPTSGSTSYKFNGSFLADPSVYVPADLVDPSRIPTGTRNSDGSFTIYGKATTDDRLDGINSRVDILYGMGGNDSVSGRGGNDKVYGGDGDDRLYGGGGNDYGSGAAGADVIEGADGDDRLMGGDGDDTVRGGNDNDTLYGGNNNDLLYGDAGNDTVYGDAGVDKLYGSTGNDALYGGDGDDYVTGYTGADAIYGGNDDDELLGDADNDRLYGGSGIDIVRGGDGDDRVEGGTGDDTLYGDAGNDSLYGGDGIDKVSAGSGNDIIYGGSGNDRLSGWTGNDVIYGEDGVDTLYGEDGNDRVYGGAGDDKLYGNDGDDRVSGGTGFNLLYGAAGSDTFVVAALEGDAADQIRDFGATDKIDFSPVLPSFGAGDRLSAYVSKKQSGSTITFTVDPDTSSGSDSPEAAVQAVAPSGGTLTGVSVDDLHDQGILIV
ncbi:G8 domain-containing protein [Marinivivus vitaminiproducens]|uniref:G8 domain-containing protein n=1 Tax=Marinivivus vitaminiproducens TaxID=3035935 RepID=UPI0027A71479|nr:G8 domain-containing protein [Geminicoccaceae bacterium SCSIO 64248]